MHQLLESSQHPDEAEAVIVPRLTDRKPRLREVEGLAQGPAVGAWSSAVSCSARSCLQDEPSGVSTPGGWRLAVGEPGRAGGTHLSPLLPGLLESRRLAGTM